MLGWEFPPVFSGGLGVVTKNLIEALLRNHQDVTLLLPQFIAQEAHMSLKIPAVKKSMKTLSASVLKSIRALKTIPTTIRSPYINEHSYDHDYNFLKHQKTFHSFEVEETKKTLLSATSEC